MLKKYAGEEFLVLEISLREKFIIPCKYIYPWKNLGGRSSTGSEGSFFPAGGSFLINTLVFRGAQMICGTSFVSVAVFLVTLPMTPQLFVHFLNVHILVFGKQNIATTFFSKSTRWSCTYQTMNMKKVLALYGISV